MLRKVRAGCILLGMFGALIHRCEAADNPATLPPESWENQRDKTFEFVWTTVNEAYFDPTFGGVDWVAVKAKYQPLLPRAADKAALRNLLQTMLGELHKSHFAIMPKEMAVYTPQERVQLGTLGIELAAIEQGVVITEVDPASAAAKAGLRPGDAITQIEQRSMEELRHMLAEAGYSSEKTVGYLVEFAGSHLRRKVGSTLSLSVRGVDGAERTVEVPFELFAGVWSEPVGDFPSLPVRCESRREDGEVVYLRFNIFARAAMKEIRAALKSVPKAGGLVIDLRGNGGGIAIMAPGISGWLSDHEFLMGSMHLRQGHIDFTVSPQTNAFLGPVAILIDGGSASTSEIMAAGLQEVGRVRVFGEPSAGAALPSSFKTLPTGDVLQYAIADLQTPAGVMLEGRGVVPDQTVRRTRADLAAGRDPVLDAAEHWLHEKRQPDIAAK